MPTLEDRLACCGLLASAEPAHPSGGKGAFLRYDLEVVLLDAIEAVPSDPSLLAPIASWLTVHGSHLIVVKLGKLATRRARPEWLPALAAYARAKLPRGHKWKPLTDSAAPHVPWPEDLTIDPGSVLTPTELARVHRQYRNRYLYGPCWRADVVTAYEVGFESAAEISRAVGCSYEPAHRILRDHRVAMAAIAGLPRAYARGTRTLAPT